MSSNLGGIFLECDEVTEGIGPGELAGVNEAHEEIADVGAMLGAKEETVCAVEDGPLERPLADMMPTAGLCRVGYCGEHVSRFRVVGDAA